MKCDEVRILLGPLLDQELPANEVAAVMAHVDNCPECSRELGDLTTLRNGLRSLPRPHVPPALSNAIIEAIGDVSNARSVPATRQWARPLLTHAAAALVGGLIVYGVALLPAASPSLAREILTAHVRSLMDERLTQVAAGDPHKVKPWFAGKVNYAPIVVDLAANGFPLAGGRVDYLGERKVAALVYMRRDHKINLFIIPEPGIGPAQTVTYTRNGYNIVGWRGRGFRFWAVSDLSAAELMAFSKAILAVLE